MTKFGFLILFIFAIACDTYGQNARAVQDSTNTELSTIDSEPDSNKIVSNTFFDIFNGNPGKAAFYGLIIPGGGQIYNKKWWKLPLVYGLEGFLVYQIVTSTTLYNGYQDAYIKKLAGDQTANYRGITDVAILKRKRDSFRKAREYSWVFFIGGHLITLFEAFIDRHLIEFDVSDDLTFTPIMTDIGLFNGFTYTIPLNKKKQYQFKNIME
jgi:hypothetical protein